MTEALFQSKITIADACVMTETWHSSIMQNVFRVVAVMWVNSIVIQLLQSCQMYVAQNRLQAIHLESYYRGSVILERDVTFKLLHTFGDILIL